MVEQGEIKSPGKGPTRACISTEECYNVVCGKGYGTMDLASFVLERQIPSVM